MFKKPLKMDAITCVKSKIIFEHLFDVLFELLKKSALAP